MKRTLIFIAVLAIVFYSCKRKNSEMIIGRWQAIKLDNMYMDSFFIKSQLFIDTVGKGHDAATNMRLYHVANMDSVRQVLQEQYNSTKAMQYASVTNTVFEFRKDSVVVTAFGSDVDSSKWYFNEQGALVLDALSEYGPGQTINMEFLSVSDTLLKLKFIKDGDTVTVTFKPEGK